MCVIDAGIICCQRQWAPEKSITLRFLLALRRRPESCQMPAARALHVRHVRSSSRRGLRGVPKGLGGRGRAGRAANKTNLLLAAASAAAAVAAVAFSVKGTAFIASVDLSIDCVVFMCVFMFLFCFLTVDLRIVFWFSPKAGQKFSIFLRR